MQLAKIQLALGGDEGNTIQKFDVTPSEVAILRLIHGNESVTEISVYGDVSRTNRAERERLLGNYGKAGPNDTLRCEPLDALFPGIAARFFDKFDELEVEDAPANFFKSRPVEVEEVAEVVEQEAPDLSKMNKTQLLLLADQVGAEVSEKDTKAVIIAAIEAMPPKADEDEDDGGIGDLSDANMFQ